MIKISITELRKHFYTIIKMIEQRDTDSIIVCRHGKPLVDIKSVHKRKSIIGAGIGILTDKPYVLDSDEYGIEEMFFWKE